MNIFLNAIPSLTRRIHTGEKILFLTFDDGPVPEVTPQVLDMLSLWNAKATFFCIGDNIRKYPVIFQRIASEGHLTGNHTFNHLNGWKTKRAVYLRNVEQCSAIMNSPKLFRPPFGRMTLPQYLALKKNYKMIFWSVLTRDWEQDRTAASCFEIVKRKSEPGSIIVFHDSVKAKDRMLPALEKTLGYFSEAGYKFESLQNYT